MKSLILFLAAAAAVNVSASPILSTNRVAPSDDIYIEKDIDPKQPSSKDARGKVVRYGYTTLETYHQGMSLTN